MEQEEFKKKRNKKIIQFSEAPEEMKFSELVEINQSLENLSKAIEKIASKPKDTEPQKVSIEGAEILTIKGEKGEKGDKGDIGPEPSNQRLQSLIKPLIPDPIPGKNGNNGKDYILTKKDKKEISELVKVPVVEKVIEKIEIVKEQPIIKEVVKEIAINESAEEIFNKLNKFNSKLNWSVLTGVPYDILNNKGGKMRGGGIQYLREARDVDPSIINASNNDVLKYNSTLGLWVAGTVAGGLTSFTSPDDSITIGGTLTDPTVQINYTHAGTWTAQQSNESIFLNNSNIDWAAGAGNDVIIAAGGSSTGNWIGFLWDSTNSIVKLQDLSSNLYDLQVDTLTANDTVIATTISATDGVFSTIRATGSGGLLLESNSGTDVVLFGAGGGSNATFYGGVNIDGATRLATSLNGALSASSGVVSAGTLSIANGGTNATSYGANRLIFMNSENTAFSSDSTLVFNGTNMGLGVSSPSAKLHVIKTSEQFRVGYDTSNYYSTTVGSTGIVTFNAVGSGSSFAFSNSVSTTGTLAQVGSASNTGYIRTNTSGSASTTNLNPGVAVFGGGGSGSMYGMDLGYNASSSRYRTRIFTGSSAGDVAFSFALANPPTSQSNFTEVMTVYGGAGGRVGIGQPSPAAKLNVVDGVADFRFSSGSGAVTPTIAMLNTGASGKAIVFGAGTSGGYVGWDDAGDFYFKTETRTTINNNTTGAGPNLGVIISSTGNWGLGTVTPQARLHLEKTTEQFRSGYNSTNYWNATTSSTGVTTFDAVGTSPKFIFSDNIELTQTVTTESLTSDTSVTIVINGTTYKLLAKA